MTRSFPPPLTSAELLVNAPVLQKHCTATTVACMDPLLVNGLISRPLNPFILPYITDTKWLHDWWPTNACDLLLFANPFLVCMIWNFWAIWHDGNKVWVWKKERCMVTRWIKVLQRWRQQGKDEGEVCIVEDVYRQMDTHSPSGLSSYSWSFWLLIWKRSARACYHHNIKLQLYLMGVISELTLNFELYRCRSLSNWNSQDWKGVC